MAKNNQDTSQYLVSPDSLPIHLLFITLGDGQIRHANQSALNMFGLSLGELTALKFPELLHGKHAEIEGHFSATSLNKKVVQLKPNISNKDIWVELYANELIHGNETCICVVLKEYSDSQLILSEFIQANVLYQNLMRITPDAAFIIDLTGKIICSTAYGQTLFGYMHADDLAHTSIFDLLVPQEITRARKHFAQVLTGTEAGMQEYTAIKKTGQNFWLELNFGIIRQQDNTPKSIFLVARDISQRKKIETELQTQETHYRTLVESARSMILHMSPDGHILFVNKYAEEFFGFAPGELVGKHVMDTIVPEIETSTNRDLSQMIEEIFHDVNNYRININENMRKNGERVWVAWSNGAIFDAQGKLIEVCSVGNDVTEQRQAQHALAEAHDQLQLQYQEIHLLQEKLRDQATRDPLTNLFNRRYLEETLLREMARCEREKIPLAIVMIDIDYFKKTNDTFGHEAGDQILRSIAALLQNHTRNEDVVCRYGGEEFIAVLPGASLDQAQKRAEFWRTEFQSLAFTFDDIAHQATFSCGVSAYNQHGNNADTLIKLADDALYQAKSNGRNQVVIYPSTSTSIV
ncbi:MAG: diguanylate cyclase [Methylophilaceae bacterium]|nr:diguanylate cyclase [Methyloradius sp.]